MFKQARGGAPRRGARRQLLSIGPVVQAATLPKSRLARWLIAPGRDVDPVLAAQLASGLYTSIPIFLGGVINSIVVAAIGAARHPEPLFLPQLDFQPVVEFFRLDLDSSPSRAAYSRAVRCGEMDPPDITALV